MTVIDLHILQAYPISLLNHSEVGQPKTVVFGGVNRTRVPSQSFRRAQLRHTERSGLVPEADLGLRTRDLPMLIAERLSGLHGMDADDALMLALNTVRGMGLLGDADTEYRTRALLFLGVSEIDRIAAEVATRHEQLLCAADAPGRLGAADESDEVDARAPRPGVALCPKAFRVLGRYLLNALGTTGAVDVALYGRSLTANGQTCIDGACSTAHAFSVGEHSPAFDWCSAGDDLGGCLPSPSLFGAPVLYRYSNLDIDTLLRSLGGDLRLAEIAAAAWLTAALYAVPETRTSSTALATRPLLALSVERADQSLSLANAYLRPVRRTHRLEDEGRSAVAALSRHWAHMGDTYGHDGVRSCHFVYAEDSTTLPAGMPGRQVTALELAGLAAQAAGGARLAV